ncbi:MAG TPA: hypothetical protein VNN22_05240 [Verrucomicrobiae bacterium]|nr:hypothetical protein [Verrucomicrobiae bacterium]
MLKQSFQNKMCAAGKLKTRSEKSSAHSPTSRKQPILCLVPGEHFETPSQPSAVVKAAETIRR